MPQEPGWAAPQCPQPASIALSPDDDPATANTDSCFSMFSLLQWVHSVSESNFGTMRSKDLPQSRQIYSKIGMTELYSYRARLNHFAVFHAFISRSEVAAESASARSPATSIRK